MAVPTSSTRGSMARHSVARKRPVSHSTIGTESRSASTSISAITALRSGRRERR